MDAITTSQAAQHLDVPLSTLKAWLERLDMPLPVDSRGRRLLDERALAVLETVRTLRERDLGYETIRRKLADQGVAVGTRVASVAMAPASEPVDLAGTLRDALRDAMAEQNYVAEAYAEAKREIGRLETRVEVLTDQLAAKDAEIRRLARELAQSRGDDHVTLLEPRPDGAPRPGWKFW